jgi:hypothetical protein
MIGGSTLPSAGAGMSSERVLCVDDDQQVR